MIFYRWNGETFVFTQSNGGYMDLARMFFKYGLSPLRLKRAVDATINSFLKMYETPIFPWKSLTQAVDDLNLRSVTSKSGLVCVQPSIFSYVSFTDESNSVFLHFTKLLRNSRTKLYKRLHESTMQLICLIFMASKLW